MQNAICCRIKAIAYKIYSLVHVLGLDVCFFFLTVSQCESLLKIYLLYFIRVWTVLYCFVYERASGSTNRLRALFLINIKNILTTLYGTIGGQACCRSRKGSRGNLPYTYFLFVEFHKFNNENK